MGYEVCGLPRRARNVSEGVGRTPSASVAAPCAECMVPRGPASKQRQSNTPCERPSRAFHPVSVRICQKTARTPKRSRRLSCGHRAPARCRGSKASSNQVPMSLRLTNGDVEAFHAGTVRQHGGDMGAASSEQRYRPSLRNPRTDLSATHPPQSPSAILAYRIAALHKCRSPQYQDSVERQRPATGPVSPCGQPEPAPPSAAASRPATPRNISNTPMEPRTK